MKRFLLVAFCTLALASMGCEKGEKTGPPPPEPMKADTPADERPAATKPGDTAEPTGGVKPADAAKPASAPAVDPAVAGQCKRILDKAWAANLPGFQLLGIENAESFEKQYKEKGDTFTKGCATLTPEQRDCLKKADNPVTGVRTCRVNEGKPEAEQLAAVEMRSQIELFAPKPLEEKAAKRQLASLKGRWVNDFKQAKIKTIWKIDKQGKVEETTVARGKKEKKKFSISLTGSNRMQVQWNEGSSQPFSFLKPAKKVFYASSNLVYGAYPMKAKNSFVVCNNWDHVVFERGKCTAVASTGETTKAKCRFSKKRGKKVFTVQYRFPDAVLSDGKPKVERRTYYVVGQHLLFDSLFETGRFLKK